LLLLLPRLQRLVPFVVLVAVLVALVLAARQFLDLSRTLETLERLDPGWLTAALVSALVYYGAKAVRWRWYMVTSGYPLAWRSALTIYLAGQWFTLARGADVSRVLIAMRFGVPWAVAIAVSSAAGIADFCGMAWIGLAGSLWHLEYLLALGVLTAITVAFVWGFGGEGPLGRMVADELPEKYAPAVQIGRRLLRGRPLVVGLAISLFDALAGAGVLLFSAYAVGVEDVGLPRAMLIYTLSQVAGGLSMIPMGLGVVEGSGVLLLVAGGVDPSVAAAVLVLFRLATLGAAMLVGCGGLATLRLCRLPAVPASSAETPSVG
jgi:uncharacterized membrane protein YbhN (UPF0104 family)